MFDLTYAPDADAQLTRLEADPASELLLSRIVETLRLIRTEPGSELARKRSYRVATIKPCFGVPVRAGDDDWLVMWHPYPDGNGAYIVYVGPGFA